MAPALGELDPGTASADFAADAARALLIAGGTDAAKPWLDAANAPELRYLAWLAGAQAPDQSDPGALFKAAFAALASHDSGAAPAEADLLVALAAALGGNLGPPDWAPFIAPPHAAKLPSAALVVDQQQAVTARRIGEGGAVDAARRAIGRASVARARAARRRGHSAHGARARGRCARHCRRGGGRCRHLSACAKHSPRREAFLEMLAAERGAARLTLAAYRNDLADCARFLAGAALEDASGDDLRRYLGALARRHMKPRTAARRLSALRQFFRFLVLEGVRRDDPTSALDAPRLGRPLPKILSENEMTALLAQAREWEGPEGLRLRAMAELLYGAGLRVSELVSLPLAAAKREPALSRRARQGRQGAARAAGRAGARGACGLSRGARPFPRRGRGIASSLPVARAGI